MARKVFVVIVFVLLLAVIGVSSIAQEGKKSAEPSIQDWMKKISAQNELILNNQKLILQHLDFIEKELNKVKLRAS
ncbi:MAG: hypothetical protein QME66_07855 [Candidatus Eisenbacteria bacterium]|nr:hypothetical protein [Candidatus Eisenbacteria bacterium]